MRFVSSWTFMKTRILFSFLLLFFTATVASDDKKSVGSWLPMAERIKVWDEVVSRELGLPLPLKEPKPYRIEPNQIEATFEKDGATWTIMGANAPIVNPTVYPKAWPVKGDGFEVLVVPEPITNDEILPFTENIENVVKSDTISITAAQDSYEPASFVIRTGDSSLKNIKIEADDLKAESKDSQGNVTYFLFPKQLIDIRVVKCWYQAGIKSVDVTNKSLVPELLLHNDDVVRLDYDNQINLIRNYKEVSDTANLLHFSIPARQNKQFWLTAHITKDIQPGQYKGRLRIESSNTIFHNVTLEINVLPFVLPPPILDYAFYYEGKLNDSDQPVIDSGLKSEKQMKAELEDMVAHGLNNATVLHKVDKDLTQWGKDWLRLKKILDIRKEVGWGNQPLLYLDWAVSFKDNLDIYKEKIRQIRSIAKENGIDELYIYGVDERQGDELAALKPLYQSVHEAGAKNFVAGEINNFLQYTDGLIDLMNVWGPVAKVPYSDKIAQAKSKGNKVFSYGNPPAVFEKPMTYRQNYGVNLYLSGADGTLVFTYQSPTPWNDWMNPLVRAYVIAYPTIIAPIPTVQWEGWREGVNDVRFLTLAKKTSGFDSHVLLNQSPSEQRKIILRFLGY